MIASHWIAAFWLLFQSGPSACEPGSWGDEVGGLRLSVELLPGNDSPERIKVTVHNFGKSQLLLPAAVVNNARYGEWPVTLVVSNPSGVRKFGRWPVIGALAGHLDPVSIPMLPNASYSFEISVTDWYEVSNQVDELRKLIHQPGDLWIEWDVQPLKEPLRNCPLWGVGDHIQITCWEHRMLSNTLHLRPSSVR